MLLRSFVLLLVFTLGCKGKPLLSARKGKGEPERTKPEGKRDAGVDRGPEFVFDAKNLDCFQPWREEGEDEIYKYVLKEFFDESSKIFFGELLDGEILYETKDNTCLGMSSDLSFKVEIPVLASYVGELVRVTPGLIVSFTYKIYI
jgi:hypothetical protein